jgi:hypothetical protein
MRNPLLISPFIPPPRSESKLANDLKHEGIRVGEIIAYRTWRVVESTWMRRTWMRRCDNRPKIRSGRTPLSQSLRPLGR